MIEYRYYQGVAVALIIINILSFLALLFVTLIYLIRWKKIASFPMRLVHREMNSPSTSASPASYRTSTSSSTRPSQSTRPSPQAKNSLASASSKPC